MRVYLSENAFLDLLLSSAEVYKRECLGFLLGYKLEDRFIIEHAFSVQTANRKHKGVVFNKKNHKKIEPILTRFNKLQKIGDFHSHTQFGPTKGLPIPSSEDIKEMAPGRIYLIVAINNNEKTMPWCENRDGMVSGSVSNFFFKISAHFLNGDSAVKRAKIHCPFPPGF
ncbi:MAG: Mov34/MPN/PAD-1 family protein [Nitrospirae bacterium]|jgi:proteasome lid subunit RPN8/RPN11|nr:Mov34/MPN/PAD-1 family protein [Nitrospirota bacterium]